MAKERGMLPFVMPTFVLMALATVAPILLTVVISLYIVDPTSPIGPVFQGLANYSALLSDDRFINSLIVMAELIVIPVIAQLVIGLLLAIVLREKLAGTRWMRLLFLLPAVIPPAVSGLVWKLFIIPGAGGLTYIGERLGVPLDINLLDRPGSALATVIVASIWVGTPLVALLLLSALESIGDEQYEAAALDGANWFRSQWHVSLPNIRPVIRTVVVFRVLEALAVFPMIFVLTGGGPASATEPVNYYAYVTGFDYLKIDYAASIIVCLFIIMLAGAAPSLTGIARKIAA